MPDRYIIAVNVKVEETVTKLGGVWTGAALMMVRAKAKVFETLDDAESAQFFVCCQYPLLTERVEIVKLESDQGRRYHLIGGVEIEPRTGDT